MNESSFDQNDGPAGDRQDPAEQYSTENQVETEPQAGAGGDESSEGDDSENPDGPKTEQEDAPEDHNAGHNLQAPESGDVSQEPDPGVVGQDAERNVGALSNMDYSEERGYRERS